jgi:hypothetical protein
MVYSNNINGATTAVVDGTGISDGLSTTGTLEWEQLQGVPGTLSILHRKLTDINSVPSDNTSFMGYYDDNSTSPASTCTGDGQAWGSSGWGAVFTGPVTTDPITNAASANLRSLRVSRIAYVDAATASPTTAEDYNALFNAPVTESISACFGGTVSVRELSPTPQLSLHPNPARDMFNIVSDRPVTLVRISTAHGQVLSSVTMQGGLTTIPVNHLPSGLYIVQVSFADGSMSTVRLVRE